MKALWHLDWLRLRRQAATWFLLGGLFLAGLTAIYLGKKFQEQQQAEISRLDAQFQAQCDRLEHRYREKGEHSGYWSYYSFYPVHQPPRPLAALSWGLRDVAPFVTSVRLLGLEQQLYESSLANPLLQSLGQFDLAFVLGVLAPLVLLLLGHDVLSRDRQLGVLPLLAAQGGGGLLRVLIARLLLRFVLVVIVCSVLFGIAILVLKLPASLDTFAWLFIALLGLLPWLALTAVIAARSRSATGSLAAAMTAFVCLVLLMPALVNLTLSTLFPVPEGLELTVRQRQVMHDGWDQPRQPNFDRYLTQHPEYRQWPTVPEKDFTWRWYYAMHEVADRSVAELVNQHTQHLRQRHAWSQRLAWLSPPALTQSLLSGHSGTDLDAHLLHLETTRNFHDQLKAHFFPLIFAETHFTAGATKSFPRFQNAAPAPAAPFNPLPPFLLALLLLPFARPRPVLS